MIRFTKIRNSTSDPYPKAHVIRHSNEFEVVALCWWAISPETTVVVGDSYKGKPCGVCERTLVAKNKKESRSD